jgi:hypothetical protein
VRHRLTFVLRWNSVYLNFGLWGISLLPAWLVIKEIGTKYSKAKREHEGVVAASPAESIEKDYDQKT